MQNLKTIIIMAITAPFVQKSNFRWLSQNKLLFFSTSRNAEIELIFFVRVKICSNFSFVVRYVSLCRSTRTKHDMVF